MAAVSKGRHVRDASFSCYLDTADTDFVRNLAASMHGSSPVFTPSRHSSSPSPCPLSKRRTRGPLGELGVFGAEGYLSEKVEYDRRSVTEDQVSQTKHKTKAMSNPSMRSESSQKSASYLTSKDKDQMKPKKSVGGPWFFQCKGSCYDAKAPVYINHLMINQPPTNQRKGFWEDQVVQINSKNQPRHPTLSTFAFPNLKHTQEEDPRKSVDVFGLHNNNITRKEEEEEEEEEDDMMGIVMERKLSMQSWDAIPITSQHKRFDDMDSDASSDLFDIAVFPAEMSPPPYEPSIEWSVVTASVSDHDEERQIINLKSKPKQVQTTSTANGGILGCRSDKAVKVITHATATATAPRMAKKTQTAATTPFSPSLSSSARIYMY